VTEIASLRDLPSPVAFLQELIRIPSLTGSEAEIAARVVAEMKSVGFDAAWTDACGNAFGYYRGLEPGPVWMLMTHLDHIDVGDLTLWPHPPMDGVLESGRVWGRGAVDIKGPLAAQVYAVATLAAHGLRPKRGVLVFVPVEEEIGGTGAAFMVDHLPVKTPDFDVLEIGACIVGEPSSNRVMLGHRGVGGTRVRFHGRAHHASLASLSENPHFNLARFLARLEHAELPAHPVLGPSTISPTVITTDTKSLNLTPNTVELFLDWRTTAETPLDMNRILETLTDGLSASFEPIQLWANRGDGGALAPGFYTPPETSVVMALQRAVLEVNPDAPEPGVWRFATDGRFTANRGIPTVGFGPGDENLAHTTQEHIEVAALEFHVAVLSRFVLNQRP
jgi:succinyl-diaminopimelate desuccinylase